VVEMGADPNREFARTPVVGRLEGMGADRSARVPEYQPMPAGGGPIDLIPRLVSDLRRLVEEDCPSLARSH